MGTYYEIVCLDCDDRGGIYADRSIYRARDALVYAEAFAAMGEAVLSSLVASSCYELVVRIGGDRVDLDFFRRHRGHELHVMDGYGWIDGQCREFISDQPCGLEDKHDGPCRASGRYLVRGKRSS